MKKTKAMKTIYYTIAIFSFLIISCSTNDENSGQENLIKISKKLNALDPSVVSQNDANFETVNKNNLRNKKTSNINYEDCQHTKAYTENYNEATTTLTTSYFDKNMIPITNCVAYNLSEYNTTESQITIGPDFKYTLNYTGNHTRPISDTKNSYSDSLLVSGELDFDGNIFTILEGSYINMDFSYDYSDQSSEDSNEIIDVNYKFEFEADSQTYHFDMTIEGEDLFEEILSEDSEFSLDYPLYNASNEQIGIIKYILDIKKDKEYFELYDLNGNLVE